MNIKNILEELRDTLSYTPAKVELHKTKVGYKGSFIIDDNVYGIHFFDGSEVNPAKPGSAIEALLLDYPESYIVEFFLIEGDKARFDTTGTGNVARVFSTVLDTIKKIIQKENAKSIFFEMPKEKNKERLYRKFLQRAGEFIPGFSGERITDKIYGIMKK